MTSQFGWMDHDDEQRRRMLAAIELFSDDGTVDELGIGSVRDTISGVLFPGASVLHTRARYLLMVPWATQHAAAKGYAPGDAVRELRRREALIIQALKAGGETNGVIGLRAGDKTKRMPSAAYWSVLRRWGVRTTDRTIDGWFRDAGVDQRLDALRPRTEDAGTPTEPRLGGFDPELPPAPDDLYASTTFTLTVDEAGYLADRLTICNAGSLLPWLLEHGLGDETTAEIWYHPAIERAPDHLRDLVERGRHFSLLVHGAALLYNLLLAQQARQEENVTHYSDRLTEWRDEVDAADSLARWERDTFWSIVRRANPGVKRPTETFVETWIERVASGVDLGGDELARTLVRTREIQLKGGRARLANPAALDQWNGASGLVRLDYNWRVAQRIVGDILNGKG